MPDQIGKATEVKQRHEKKWLGLKGVTAVGIGLINGGIGIIISVESNIEKVRAKIPQYVEGIPTKVQPTGTLKAF